MALATLVQASIKLLSADDSTFQNRSIDDIFDFDQTTILSNSYSTIYPAQVTGQAIDFGEVAIPTFVFVRFTSTATGAGTNAIGTHEAVSFRINGGTSDHSDLIMLWTGDPDSDILPNTIVFDTVSNSSTNVQVFVAGLYRDFRAA